MNPKKNLPIAVPGRLAIATIAAVASIGPGASAQAAATSGCTVTAPAHVLAGETFSWSATVQRGGIGVPGAGVGYSADNGMDGEWYALAGKNGTVKQKGDRIAAGVHQVLIGATVEKPGGEREYEECTATQLLVAAPKKYAAAGSVGFGGGQQAGFYAEATGGAVQAQVTGGTLLATAAPAVSVSGNAATLSGAGSWNGEAGASYVLHVTASSKTQPATVALSVTVGEATVYTSGGSLAATDGTVKVK